MTTCATTFTKHIAKETVEEWMIFKGYVYWVSDQTFFGKRLVGYDFIADKDWEERTPIIMKGHEYFWFTSCVDTTEIPGTCCVRIGEFPDIECLNITQAECVDTPNSFRWVSDEFFPGADLTCLQKCREPDVGICCIPPKTIELGALNTCVSEISQCDCYDLGGIFTIGGECPEGKVPYLGDVCNPIGRCCPCSSAGIDCIDTTKLDCDLLTRHWDGTHTCASGCPGIGACCRYQNLTSILLDFIFPPVLACFNSTCEGCGCVMAGENCVCEEGILPGIIPAAVNLNQRWAAECVLCESDGCCPPAMDTEYPCCHGPTLCTMETTCHCSRTGGSYVWGSQSYAPSCADLSSSCPYYTCCGSILPDDLNCFPMGPQGIGACNSVGTVKGPDAYCSTSIGPQDEIEACEYIPPTDPLGACCTDSIGCGPVFGSTCVLETLATCQDLNGVWHEGYQCDAGISGCCTHITICCAPGYCDTVYGGFNSCPSGTMPFLPGNWSCTNLPPECQ